MKKRKQQYCVLRWQQKKKRICIKRWVICDVIGPWDVVKKKGYWNIYWKYFCLPFVFVILSTERQISKKKKKKLKNDLLKQLTVCVCRISILSHFWKIIFLMLFFIFEKKPKQKQIFIIKVFLFLFLYVKNKNKKKRTDIYY